MQGSNLNAAALVANTIAVVTNATWLDWLNSTYAAATGFTFRMNMLAGAGNAFTAITVLYVLQARMFIFYKVIPSNRSGKVQFLSDLPF